MLAILAINSYNILVTTNKEAHTMQTKQRLVSKQLNAQVQQAIATYLQSNAVQRIAYAARATHNTMRTKHIGKNCATRMGARV